MRFDPVRKELYSDSGEFIKKLNCPYRMKWDEMQAVDSTQRTCATCDHSVLDTAMFSDSDLLEMVSASPSTCLKVDLNQENVTLIHHGTLRPR